MKYDTERIGTRLQQRFRWNAPAAEHIVSFENRLIIEIDIGKSIQPLENQIEVLMPERDGINLKSRLILPIGQANPLQMKLVVPIERIEDELAIQQIRLHHARNLRGVPLFDIGSLSACHSAKLPAGIQIARGRLGRLQRRRDQSEKHQTA